MVEPPVWVPMATGACRSPTAAPEPEEEPPGVRDGLCGLRVVAGPVYEAANSAVVVLPGIREKRKPCQPILPSV
jgi:hypothetical protein